MVDNTALIEQLRRVGESLTAASETVQNLLKGAQLEQGQSLLDQGSTETILAPGEIKISVAPEPSELAPVLSDSGNPFDPLSDPQVLSVGDNSASEIAEPSLPSAVQPVEVVPLAGLTDVDDLSVEQVSADKATTPFSVPTTEMSATSESTQEFGTRIEDLFGKSSPATGFGNGVTEFNPEPEAYDLNVQQTGESTASVAQSSTLPDTTGSMYDTQNTATLSGSNITPLRTVTSSDPFGEQVDVSNQDPGISYTRAA